jgi:hypothetical protein
VQIRNDLALDFQKKLSSSVSEDVLSSQVLHLLTQMVAETLTEYANLVAEKLEEKYRHWEDVMDGEDTSLYTLGLRHARDILLEQSTDDRAKVLAVQYEKELAEDGNDEQEQEKETATD